MKKASQKHRVIAAMMSAVMVFTGLSGLTAMADARVGTHKVLTLGADLTEEEIQTILRFFDVDESEVEVMTITNQDERDHLLGLVPEDQIGTHTYSCALVCPTEDNGIQVTTANMSYVTSDMIAATLSTSGVVNCDVLTAAPFRVSGTGALTGVMMSYEQASGETLDEAKKALANEELVVTNDVGEDVGQNEAILIVNGIKIRVVKDQVKGEEQVKTVVDEVVNNVETQINEKAAETGRTTVHVSEENKEKLVEYGTKYAEEDYQYDDVKDTLERVTKNTVEITGITDPVTDSFDNTADDTVSEDSILNDVNDDALGDDAGVNSTAANIEDAQQVSVDVKETEALPMAQADNTQLVYPVREVSLSQIAQFTGYEFNPISGSNRISAEENSLYAVMDYDGNLLTGYDYYRIYAEHAVLTVTDADGKKGVLNQNGEVLVPCKYDEVSVKSSLWAIGIMLEETDDSEDHDYTAVFEADKYFVITSADLYDLTKPGSAPLRSLTREEANLIDCNIYSGPYFGLGGAFYDRELNQLPDVTEIRYLGKDGKILTLIEQEGEDYTYMRGLSDLQGNVVLSPVYNYINEGCSGLYNADKDGKRGLVAAGDNVAVPFEHDSYRSVSITSELDGTPVRLRSYCPGGYFSANDEDQYSYVVWGGEVTGKVPVAYSDIDWQGAAASSYIDEQGLYHIYSADNTDSVFPESITGLNPLDADGIGFFWVGRTENGDKYLFDWHGNQLLDETSGNIEISNDGRYITAGEDDITTVYEVSYKTDNGDLHVLQSGWGTEFNTAEAAAAAANKAAAPETEVTEPETTPSQPETAAAETEAAAPEPETAAEGNEAEQTASGAGAYLSSAIILLQSGVQNIESVKNLINQAISALPDGSEAAGILASTITLMEGGSTDTGSMITLLETAKGML